MRPWIGHPNYVYTPWSEERRAKMRSVHRRRLGIPEGCVRIYGIDVPAEMDKPLRNYASWVKQKKGFNAARFFVRKAVAQGKITKPTPNRYTIQDRHYTYRPWPTTVYTRIARLAMRDPVIGPYAMLYGIRVPADHLDIIKAHAQRARQRAGLQAARWVVCEAWAAGWPHMEPPGARLSVDLGLVENLIADHATIEEVAEYLGVTLAYLKTQMNKRRRRP